MTLAEAVGRGDAVTVGYAKPSTVPLQDQGGNYLESFSDQTVTNETGSGELHALPQYRDAPPILCLPGTPPSGKAYPRPGAKPDYGELGGGHHRRRRRSSWTNPSQG